jgi:predicted ABC-type ATPase
MAAARVAHGGHIIPTADIERRFSRSLGNLFHLFSTKVNACRCFMNSDASPELVFEQHEHARRVIHHPYYELLLKEVP